MTVVAVFGSTGAQGGSVARALLKNGFKVRALTRNPDSESAKALKNQGAEIVKCDDADPKESIEKALKGSDSVFCVTNFWAYFHKELEYGINIANAALSAGVKHFVFSGLAPCNKISGGKYNVPHFDLKYKIEEHLRELSKNNPSFVTSFVYVPFYMQNFKTYFAPKRTVDEKTQDVTYVLGLPSDPKGLPLDMGDVDDIGSIVAVIMKEPSKYSGKVIPYSGDALHGDKIAEIMSKATGKKVVFNFIQPKEYAQFGFPGAEEMAEMFSFYNEFGAFNKLDKTEASKMAKITNLEEFLRKSKFQLE
ncbi:hypothetical protein RB653_002271 [Dictyostelium firmibasis]|uniref:NmrA-like family domain-containing protein 1 n=1 Tax=Dictyostelium firmibasis TaxID=79012 RepID=A0AAN7TY58_9MYCE